jgi:hypothetical protein
MTFSDFENYKATDLVYCVLSARGNAKGNSIPIRLPSLAQSQHPHHNGKTSFEGIGAVRSVSIGPKIRFLLKMTTILKVSNRY